MFLALVLLAGKVWRLATSQTQSQEAHNLLGLRDQEHYQYADWPQRASRVRWEQRRMRYLGGQWRVVNGGGVDEGGGSSGYRMRAEIECSRVSEGSLLVAVVAARGVVFDECGNGLWRDVLDDGEER